MSQCANCNSNDADPDIGLCFECFCGPEQQYPEPTDADYCAGYGHAEYNGAGRCYCGAKTYERKSERGGDSKMILNDEQLAKRAAVAPGGVLTAQEEQDYLDTIADLRRQLAELREYLAVEGDKRIATHKAKLKTGEAKCS